MTAAFQKIKKKQVLNDYDEKDEFEICFIDRSLRTAY